MKDLVVTCLVITLLSVAVVCEAANPWLQTFTASREFYVSPNGSGSGTSQSDPMSFSAAISSADAGDLFWMLGGTYPGAFTLSRNGTQANPIVFRAFGRDHVKVLGTLQLKGAYTWIWGLEVTNPTPGVALTGISTYGVGVFARGVHLINNVIHDIYDTIAVGFWDVGPDMVMYGNIMYGSIIPITVNTHFTYSQNTFATAGYKYLVSNIWLDSQSLCKLCYSFHGYATNAVITGFHLEKNISRSSRWLLGGFGEPAVHERIIGNYFYDEKVELGYARPTQAEFKDNYLGRCLLQTAHFWGQDSGSPPRFIKPGPNIYTGNSFMYSNTAGRPHVIFYTEAYINDNKTNVVPLIDTQDIWDNNTYDSTVKMEIHAGGIELFRNFTQWQDNTQAAGKRFDVNSQVVPGPTTPAVFVIPNEYDPARAHVAVYNWGLDTAVAVDLSSVISNGSTFSIVPAKDPFGSPVVTGTYNGPVSIPLNNAEFGAFLVTRAAETSPPSAISIRSSERCMAARQPPLNGIIGPTASSINQTASP